MGEPKNYNRNAQLERWKNDFARRTTPSYIYAYRSMRQTANYWKREGVAASGSQENTWRAQVRHATINLGYNPTTQRGIKNTQAPKTSEQITAQANRLINNIARKALNERRSMTQKEQERIANIREAANRELAARRTRDYLLGINR